MRSLAAVCVVLAGFSLWSCSDEEPGPGVGPEFSWQIGCAANDVGCSTSEDPHGPLAGRDEEITTDDQKFSVSCKKTNAGLQIVIRDPGAKADTKKMISARAASTLEIANAQINNNKCIVTVTEYPRSGAQQKKMIETCMGNTTEPEGTCVLEGEENSNGYAFEGTLQCDGMRINNAGNPDYKLRRAREPNEPVALQIADCN